ncbi:hypothetical protein EXIGLDRAFT_724260 [Exidia glandulosa HHB12029]|uniref:CFEM domain-containing protein n=1 Tax=Exidia glandulosa HHB12029 TaxID=1314781 RepID=A0A165MSU3_EXIGL|nr:hypothetical protein EXIGLDRAFT_724260 [Exidia glandulosa HHB12029]
MQMRSTSTAAILLAVATLLLMTVHAQAQPSNIDQCISNCTDASIQNAQVLSLCTTGDRNAQFACVCSTRLLRAALEGCVAGTCVDVHEQAVAKLDSECDAGSVASVTTASGTDSTSGTTGSGSTVPPTTTTTPTTTSASSDSDTATGNTSSSVVAGGPSGTGTGTGEPSASTGAAGGTYTSPSVSVVILVAILYTLFA